MAQEKTPDVLRSSPFLYKKSKMHSWETLAFVFSNNGFDYPPIHPSGAYLHVWQKLSAPFPRSSIYSHLRLLELGKNLLTLGAGRLEVTNHVEGTYVHR